ncbi:hypothetical protein [Geobacillus sp. TFV-3]|uniref:hypothetical protein n=1 Tax=Geobacillus sp. TFV-3 TaxID=1897059 RepID=UPI00135CA698|nr:hypothetical protein [Geobacillus sp. TFV-3]KAF0995224.1 hypothetical protein BJQ97_01885 [Geobacillus sp. TFV-3]
MDIRKEFEHLQYFFDSYYNQTFYNAELEEQFLQFLANEPEWMVRALKLEVEKLERIYHRHDTETWAKIEELVHENSMRYFSFEDRKKFIKVASRLLKDIE